jgi:pyrroline-5-carboxylate reductase
VKINFIGGGNMASALISGLAGKLTSGADIHVVDPDPAALEALHRQFGVSTSMQFDQALAGSDVIVLAVKPDKVREVATALVPYLSAQLIVSIAAGIRGVDLSRWANHHQAVVRAMPNTPALIGQGITGLVPLPGVSAAQRELADQILSAVGATVWLDDESQIDAVTAVSGSGPAYVFYFIEAMQQAAQELGLTAEQGIALAKATFSGASQLAVLSSEPVALLRERVTSKGGTTYAALTSMEESGVKPMIVKAIKAAAARGKAMGEAFGDQP